MVDLELFKPNNLHTSKMSATNRLTHMTEDVIHQATKYTKDHLAWKSYGYKFYKTLPSQSIQIC